MKIIILTNDTSHHAYFIRELNKYYPIFLAIIEENSVSPNFEIMHPFEIEREKYENLTWFSGNFKSVKEYCENLVVKNINEPKSIELIKQVSPDVVIDFGTRKVEREIVDLCRGKIINLHGGYPEFYKGLDSMLWAIYHNEWEQLGVTLHYLDYQLDNGRIILQSAIDLIPGMELHQLRSFNTEICIKMTVNGLDQFKRFETFMSRPQVSQGKYYSFMPRELKDICLRKFKKKIGSLNEKYS